MRPRATITPATYAATEQVGLTLHGTGLSIADADAGGADITATLSVVSGTLTVNAGDHRRQRWAARAPTA